MAKDLNKKQKKTLNYADKELKNCFE